MKILNAAGVPDFECYEFLKKKSDFCLCIPVLNEGKRIEKELVRAFKSDIHRLVDIVICDGDSSDGSTGKQLLRKLGVNALLVKKGEGRQGAQLRMGFWWCLRRGYKGIVTIDGNDKDSIEDVPMFIAKLKAGYDFIQGSRYIKGGGAINTPLMRHLSVKYIHSPLISIAAGKRYTDTTNAFRGYSSRYLLDERVLPFRDVFNTYELLAYLSVRAAQLGLKTCEIPVIRKYPKRGKIPTKISFFKGNILLLKILLKNLFRGYHP